MTGLADRRDDEDGQPIRARSSPELIYRLDVGRELPEGPAGRALFLIQEREFGRVVVMLRSGTVLRRCGATLDDLREAVSTLEETERIARRVFGGAHPLVRVTEDFLRKSRRALSDREALLAKYLLYGASALAIAAFALVQLSRRR
jgi:hypothetical protein